MLAICQDFCFLFQSFGPLLCNELSKDTHPHSAWLWGWRFRGSESKRLRGSNTEIAGLKGHFSSLLFWPLLFFSFYNYVDIKRNKENLRCCLYWSLVLKVSSLNCLNKSQSLRIKDCIHVWKITVKFLTRNKLKKSHSAVSVAALGIVSDTAENVKWKSQFLQFFQPALN